MTAARRFGSFGALGLLLACTRTQAPAFVDAAVPPPPPAPAPAVDAGPDTHDGAADAPDGSGTRRKHAGGPSGGGGGKVGLEVSGGLPKPEAAKVLRAKAPALRACYEQERARNPSLRGRVSFKLTVDGRGRVTLGEIASSTLGATATEMCMVEATRGFKFPVTGGESTVSFQMSFP